MFDHSKEFDVVAEAKRSEQLIEKVAPKELDALIIDALRLSKAGIKELKKLRRVNKRLPVLVITSNDYSDCFAEYINLGVKGLIFEESNTKELLTATKELCKGKNYFCSGIPPIIKNSRRKSPKSGSENPISLTEREETVLKLLCQGLSYKEIASELYISPRTVESHKQNIQLKLNLKSTAEIVKYAFHNNIFY